MLRIPLGDDAFGDFIQHDHPVGNGQDTLEFVCHDDHGRSQASVELDDQMIYTRGCDRVKASRRLVKKKNFRIEGHRPGQAGSLFHAPAQFGRQMVFISFQAHDIQLYFYKKAQRLRGEVRVLSDGKRDVFGKGHGTEKGTALIEDADFSENIHQCHGVSFRNILTVNDDLAGMRLIKPHKVLEKRAFPAAAAAEDDKDLTLIDIERYPFEDGLFIVLV